jgi:metallo-beta-lactamase class B
MKTGLAMGLVLAAAMTTASAQPTTDNIESHLTAAKRAAGFDFTGTLTRLCLVPRAAEPRGTGPRVIPDRATWYAEPAKVFDNLYFVGTKVHSSWALKTSGGIILIDTLFNYAAEAEIVDGLKKLGLDPATIKYVIVSHAHGDHDEGARLLQDRYGAHIVFGAPDWDSIEKMTDMPGGAPKRDIAATDGQKITLGDGGVTIITTPGHTPGTLSLLFQVKDHGKPLTVIYPGGTAFNFPNDVPHYDIYIASQHKMAALAASEHPTVLLTNHSEFDNAWTKTRLLKARRPGDPSPFENGADAVARYFTVTTECAEAERLHMMGAH